MRTRIMIDVETLGLKIGSVIASLGAVKFGGGKILAQFYQIIDVQSQLDIGMQVDGETIQWWLRQGDEARAEMARPGQYVTVALSEFNQFIGLPGEVDLKTLEIWGNGASFDNVLLRAAYEKAHCIRPWQNRNDRCYRTMAKLRTDIVLDRTGTHHHALDDARCQALHLMRVEEALGLPTD